MIKNLKALLFAATILLVSGVNVNAFAGAPDSSLAQTKNEDRTQSFPPEMKGSWNSFEYTSGGDLFIRKQSGNGSSFSGEISFGNSDYSCWGYHPFKGTVAKDGALTITSNLGGACGVVVIKVPTPGRKWSGTYDAEFPDNGAVELSPT
ncbi:MAG: hypothetical protein IID18_09710 [Nitrospinae bacterium]|nr:hypothetical protein [Nitrospinota bacterium]